MSLFATVRAWGADVDPQYKLLMLALAESNFGDSDEQFVSVDFDHLAKMTGYLKGEILELLIEMQRRGMLDLRGDTSITSLARREISVRDRYDEMGDTPFYR